MASTTEYEGWTREELIERLKRLESLNSKGRANKVNVPLTSSNLASSYKKPAKPFVFSSHPTRKIALKFCYYGPAYNGLAWQDIPTPLPTVEGELFKAFCKTHLVDESAGLEGCGWDRCGRTDRGVSSAGQVVSLWVRSNIGKRKSKKVEGAEYADDLAQDTTVQEIRYVTLLNRVLPSTIRVLAWSPVSPSFSARFSCNYRHYKYFFSSRALDLSRMRDGANRLVGEHDFRNLCKVDASKQISNFRRRVLTVGITELGHDGLCVFDLKGTAFLYHQVRHIMAVLFLIGSGLEHPSLVSSLINVEPTPEELYSLSRTDDPPLETVTRKPEYQMADALPLMLWECGFSEEDIQWQMDEEVQDANDSHPAATSTKLDTNEHLRSAYTQSVIASALYDHFLSTSTSHNLPIPPVFPFATPEDALDHGVLSIPLGGGTSYRTAKYVEVLKRKRLDSVEVINERWRAGKGERRAERKIADSEGEADEE